MFGCQGYMEASPWSRTRFSALRMRRFTAKASKPLVVSLVVVPEFIARTF
jgi:hypothetical protein